MIGSLIGDIGCFEIFRGGVVRGDGGRAGKVRGLDWRARTKSWKLGGGWIMAGGLGLGMNRPWNACIRVLMACCWAGLWMVGLCAALPG